MKSYDSYTIKNELVESLHLTEFNGYPEFYYSHYINEYVDLDVVVANGAA